MAIVKDWTKYLKKVRLTNTNENGNDADNRYNTTDFVYLPSLDDVRDIPSESRITSLTDFALANYAWQAGSARDYQGRLAGAGWLRSGYSRNSVRSLNVDGSLDSSSAKYRNDGAAPVFVLDLPSEISARSAQRELGEIEEILGPDGEKRHLLSLGEYPQLVSSQEEAAVLEKLYNNGNLQAGLECTGRLYTTNGRQEYNEDFLSKQNPEFVYNGQKYVRAVVWNSADNKFSDNSTVPRTGNTIWLKVEPLKLRIENWKELERGTKTLKLQCDQMILAGLPFYPDWGHENCSMWQNSLWRAFLNSAKSSELDGHPDHRAEYQWDFTNRGFLYEALNMERGATREFVIPEYEKEVANYAFEGCVGLEKIIIHNGVTTIGERAFSGLTNSQVIFDNPANKLKINQESFGSGKFKYFYLTKDGRKIILSAKQDEELDKTCIRNDFNLEEVNKYFNANYRTNLIQLKEWRESGKIKFIPPEYTLMTFPASQMANYFVNNNNQRWGKLVKTLGFDTLEGTEKNNSLVDLMKIYYAIGGFSSNQGESEKAFEYVLNYVAKGKAIVGREGYVYVKNPSPSQIGVEIHARFSKLQLKGEFNPLFAKFFMKYYKDNPDFMNFRLKDKDGDLMDSQDYLCAAHNSFETILKNYPNRTVAGNEERALLTPRFVAEHSCIVEY